MARYDRIAPLPPPDRAAAFPGWPVLRDIEGRERDQDTARRVRLRFLAMRPVRRLVRHGIHEVPPASFERQVEGVREELGQLSARDPERARLAQFLHQIRQRTPLAVTTATLDLGEVAEAAEHYFGAEELYTTALEMADSYHLSPEQVIALRLLGRIFRKTDRWREAERSYRRAAELALRLDDRRQWVRAMDGLGVALRAQRQFEDAARLYEEIRTRGEEWEHEPAIAYALSGLCLTALEAGDPERAVEHGWAAVGRLGDDEQRNLVLNGLGGAFVRLGLYGAAERCLTLVAAQTTRPASRAQARLELAAVAARAGQMDAARDHLRAAIGAAREHGLRDLLRRAEQLLTALEQELAAEVLPTEVPPAGATARRIAAEIVSRGSALVPASG